MYIDDIKNLVRYSRYTFWVGLEIVLFLGIPRLVVFPLCAHAVGRDGFGQFLFALGIIMMIGNAPSVGLFTGIFREMAGLEPHRQDLLLRTGLRLCRVAMLVILLLGLAGILIAAILFNADRTVLLCLLPLLAWLYAFNEFTMLLVPYRVHRWFAARTAWFGVFGLSLGLAVPGAYLGGVFGMSVGYALGGLLPYTVLAARHGALFTRQPYDPLLGAALKKVWLHISIASALTLSSRYAYRIILGSFHSYGLVSVFFGATNMIDLFVTPLSIVSSLLLSMLSGFVSLETVGRKQKALVLSVGVLVGTLGPLFAYWVGPPILAVLFPDFSAESAGILRRLVFVIPCIAAVSFSRPFIAKFGPTKFVPILNVVVLTAHLMPAILLIPSRGIAGAETAYYCGYGVAAVAWLMALVWVFRLRQDRIVSTEDVPASDLA